jgi:hypothetical protein
MNRTRRHAAIWKAAFLLNIKKQTAEKRKRQRCWTALQPAEERAIVAHTI